jgi:hypothetical protein
MKLLFSDLIEAGTVRKENKILTGIGFAILPLFASVLVSGYIKPTIIIFTGCFIALLLTFSGSKVGGVGVLLVALNAFYYKGGDLNFKKLIFWGGLAFLFPLSVYSLAPGRFSDDTPTFFNFINRILYRLVGTNDQIAYIIENNININNYPYSSPLQLIDPFLKLMGLRSLGFEYSVGEWIYGQIYGIWTGVGPNPSYILEFWLGLGYFAPIFFIFIGYILKLIKSQKNPLVFGIYIMLPTFFVDVSFFQIVFISFTLCILCAFIISLVSTCLLKIIAYKI